MANVVAPTAPSTLTDMSAIALQMKAFNKTLRTESVLHDVFEKLVGDIRTDPRGIQIPEAIFLRLEQPPQGTHSAVVPLLKSLELAPREGNLETMLGNEENLRLKHLTVFYNEIKKSVASFGWGIDYNDLSYMNVYGQINPLMTRFFAEWRGRRIREASLLTVARELTKSPISIVQHFTPNIFVANTLLGSMPTFDTTAHLVTTGAYPVHDKFEDATAADEYIESIGDALEAATNAGANGEFANMDVQDLLALAWHVEHNLLIEPIMIDGQPTHIFLIPSNHAVKLSDPTTTGTLGDVWKSVTYLTKKEQDIPAVLGRVKNLLLVSDSRYPTVKKAGLDSDWTLEVGFLNPGRNDGRIHTAFADGTNEVWDIGFVYGKGALVEWVSNPLKYATEQTEYGQLQGKGAFQMAGIQMAVFDEDTQTNTSFQQNSSCAVFMSKADLVTVQ